MYIFGIDVPIMEALFLLGILLLGALILIWLELRKLGDIIIKEKAKTKDKKRR